MGGMGGGGGKPKLWPSTGRPGRAEGTAARSSRAAPAAKYRVLLFLDIRVLGV